jgi:hypothetical protein
LAANPRKRSHRRWQHLLQPVQQRLRRRIWEGVLGPGVESTQRLGALALPEGDVPSVELTAQDDELAMMYRDIG